MFLTTSRSQKGSGRTPLSLARLTIMIASISDKLHQKYSDAGLKTKLYLDFLKDKENYDF